MKKQHVFRALPPAWLWIALGLGVVAFLPVLPVVGPAWLDAFVRALFSHACHQDPSRSFSTLGVLWAACQRCSGIYFGLFAAALVIVPLIARFPRLRRWASRSLIASAILLVADWAPAIFGIPWGSPISRFTTGFLFGVTAGFFLSEAFLEWSGYPADRLFRVRPPSASECHTQTS